MMSPHDSVNDAFPSLYFDETVTSYEAAIVILPGVEVVEGLL